MIISKNMSFLSFGDLSSKLESDELVGYEIVEKQGPNSLIKVKDKLNKIHQSLVRLNIFDKYNITTKYSQIIK